MLLEIDRNRTLYIVVKKSDLTTIYSNGIGDFEMYTQKPPISKLEKVLKIDSSRLYREGYDKNISVLLISDVYRKYRYSGRVNHDLLVF